MLIIAHQNTKYLCSRKIWNRSPHLMPGIDSLETLKSQGLMKICVSCLSRSIVIILRCSSQIEACYERVTETVNEIPEETDIYSKNESKTLLRWWLPPQNMHNYLINSKTAGLSQRYLACSLFHGYIQNTVRKWWKLKGSLIVWSYDLRSSTQVNKNDK